MVSHLQTVGPGKAAMQFENLRADGQIPGYVWSTTNQEYTGQRRLMVRHSPFSWLSVLFWSGLQKVDDAHEHWRGADTLLSLLLQT